MTRLFLASLALVAMTSMSQGQSRFDETWIQKTPPKNLFTPDVGYVAKNAPIPPPQFDVQYKGRLTITNLEDYSIIRYICRNNSLIACAIFTPTDCLILLGPGTWASKEVLRHELGHCNGWSNNHEGAR